eukprot:1066038-Pleurochrysis_carterae.AAC.1
MLVQDLDLEQRSVLRELLSVQQERFLVSRDLCQKLRSDFFTPKAALTVRLENFLSTRAMDRANSVLSKKQLDDGTWRRPILPDVPKGSRVANRALGINAPLRMFN